MGRGGKVGSKPCDKRRIRSKDNGSDESDEDYTVGGDEEFNDSEDYTSFTGEESEESLGEFEEEEDEVEEKVRKASRSKGRKAFMGRKKNGVGKARKKRKVSYKVEDDEDFEDEDEDEDFEVKSGVGKARKKRKVSYKVEDDEDFEDEDFKEKNGVGKARYKRKVSYKVEDDEDFEVEDDEDFEEKNGIGKARSKRKVSYKVEDDEDFKDEGDDEDFEEKNGIGKARNKRKVSYKVEDDDDFKDEGDDEDFEDEGDDEDFEDEGVDDEDDDEFAPDEIDLYDEDELAVGKKKKKKVRRPFLENGRVKGRKRKRNSKVIKKPMRKKLTKSRGLRRNSVDGAFTEKKPVVKERNKKNSGQRNRRIMTDSDPDFVSSGLSDFDYTISEEEREQVREASKFCRDLTTALRSSFLTKRSQEEGVLFHHQRKRSGRKGKGKVEDLKNEAVCGICFSEEGKKTVRGTLNCCSHYFCFTCIMEWSKVESRCPLCKQRFASISKPAKSNTGFDLRTVVIQVPERDQVYQPSEEELRGYLDPYENVICTECEQGGDDALMLLCDLCDSPAHTFCVGLGREVPEGSWYCEGCRPTAFASSNPQAPNPTPNHRTINDFSGRSSPVENVREAIDLNSAYVPETPLNHGTGIFSSPRHPVGDFQAASPVSGTGVLTVSVRRRIQRQIHDMLSNRSQSGSRIVGMSASTSGNNLLGSQIEQGREVAFQHAITPERSSSHQPFSQGRFQGNFMPSVQSTRDLSSARLSHSRGQPIQGQSSTSGADGSANRMLQAGFAGISRGMNSRLGYEQQLHPCGSRSSIADDSMSPYRYREVSHFNVEKEQVQSMVRSHLKSLSREMELGYSTTFKDIARISTHTILASCGIEHQVSEVYPVQPPSMCNHAEAMAGGQTSLMKGFCTSCFDSFVRRVVREITNTQSASSIV